MRVRGPVPAPQDPAARHLGAGVPLDHKEAVRWYRPSAEQGDAAAQFFLAAAYDFGSGVEPDSVAAQRWYLRAAEQGSEDAQLNAGLLVPVGPPEPAGRGGGPQVATLAAIQGNGKARKMANELYGQLTPEQRSEAASLIEQWGSIHNLD